MGLSDQQEAEMRVAMDSELDRFVHHISHDLRASVRALTLIPQWIEEDLREEFGDIPASIREHVQSLTLDLVLDLEVPALVGGAEDIKTLLSVLVSNGFKHGGGKLNLSSRETESGVALTLRDEGPGIAGKFHKKIFEAMTTLKPRDEVEGSGMGLAIARKIMDHHGGTIQVISNGADQGATFVATFPSAKKP